LAKQVQIKKHEIMDGWSYESADFINKVEFYLYLFSLCWHYFGKMIQRKPNNRLGCNGVLEVKQHPWLRTFPWEKLLKKELQAPFLPSVDYYYHYYLFLQISIKNYLQSQKKIILMPNNKSALKAILMKISFNRMHFY